MKLFKKEFALTLIILSFVGCTTTSNGKETIVTSSQTGFFDTELPRKYPPILFDMGKAELTAEQKIHLKNIAQDINGYNKADHKIFIEGYTDAIGDDDFNKALSYKRAKNVKEVLAEYGVNTENVVIKAFGEDKLFANDNQASLVNRRVMIKTNDRYKTYSINVPTFQ